MRRYDSCAWLDDQLHAGVSAGHLNRLVRAASGRTAVGYLRYRRMQQARHHLRDTTLSVAAVAASVGIPDLQAFNKAIKIDHPPTRDANGLLRGPVFVWLSRPEATRPTAAVKLGLSYDHAVATARATPTTMSGLGHWGWLTVPLERIDLEMMCDWIDESYRLVAPKKLIASLDSSRPPR